LSDADSLAFSDRDGHFDVRSTETDYEVIRTYWRRHGQPCPFVAGEAELKCPFSEPFSSQERYAQTQPDVRIDAPDSFASVAGADVVVSGVVAPGSTVAIADRSVVASEDGAFSIRVDLEMGVNDLLVSATEPNGRSKSYLRAVRRVQTSDEFLESCRDIEYRVLKKDHKRLLGQPVHIAGGVVGITEKEDGHTWIRVAMPGASRSIVIDDSEPFPYYEDDRIEVWGLVNEGFTSQDTRTGEHVDWIGITARFICAAGEDPRVQQQDQSP
jgi:hypothetical protein